LVAQSGADAILQRNKNFNALATLKKDRRIFAGPFHFIL